MACNEGLLLGDSKLGELIINLVIRNNCLLITWMRNINYKFIIKKIDNNNLPSIISYEILNSYYNRSRLKFDNFLYSIFIILQNVIMRII